MTMGLVGFLINAGLLLLVGVHRGLLRASTCTVGDFPPDLLTADTIVAAVIGAIVSSDSSPES